MLSDIKRKRDRYECILDNFPPLIDNPTSVANIVVQFMEEVFVAISVIKVSGNVFSMHTCRKIQSYKCKIHFVKCKKSWEQEVFLAR